MWTEKRRARNEAWARHAKLFRTEPTNPASSDQPALNVSHEDALMELIVSPQNLRKAWRQVKGNRGAPGPDGVTVHEFEAWAGENWTNVRQQLIEETYQPQPVRRKTIPKGVIKATLVRASFSSWHRPIQIKQWQTRMLGGVGATVSNGGGYPISPPVSGMGEASRVNGTL